MNANREKLTLAMARACVNPADVAKKADMPLQTVNRALLGRVIRPATMGRIAKALGVDPAELIQEGG